MSVQTAPQENTLLNHTLLLPPASPPFQLPTESHGLDKAQQEGVKSLSHSLAGQAESRRGTAAKELCESSLDRYKSIGTPKTQVNKAKDCSNCWKPSKWKRFQQKDNFPNSNAVTVLFQLPKRVHQWLFVQ